MPRYSWEMESTELAEIKSMYEKLEDIAGTATNALKKICADDNLRDALLAHAGNFEDVAWSMGYERVGPLLSSLMDARRILSAAIKNWLDGAPRGLSEHDVFLVLTKIEKTLYDRSLVTDE